MLLMTKNIAILYKQLTELYYKIIIYV